MKKKMAGAVLAGIMVFALGSISVSADGYDVVLLPSCTGNTWWDLSGEAVVNWGKETGNQGFYVGSTNYDAAEQLSILQDEIAQQPDAILLQPVSADSVEDACAEAMEKGIVMIGVEAADVEHLNYNVVDHTNDTYCPHLVDLLVEKMGDSGKWVYMTPSLENATWVSYATDARTYAESAYPGLETVEDIIGAGGADFNSAYNTTKELLMKYPDLTGIISQGQSAAVGAAVAELGLSDKVTVIGSGCMPSENAEAISNGSVDAVCTSSPIALTEAMANLALKVCAGEEFTDTVDLGVEGYENCTVDGMTVTGQQFMDIDSENIDEWKDLL